MSEAIVCAIIAGIVSVLGTWLANRRSQAVFQAVILFCVKKEKQGSGAHEISEP